MLVWSGGRGRGRKETCSIRERCQRKSKNKLSLSKQCFGQIEGFEISLSRSLSGDHARERVPTDETVAETVAVRTSKMPCPRLLSFPDVWCWMQAGRTATKRKVTWARCDPSTDRSLYQEQHLPTCHEWTHACLYPTYSTITHSPTYDRGAGARERSLGIARLWNSNA